MSGPYALAAFGDAIFQGQVSASSPTNVALLVSAYQNAYGTVYSAPSQTFEATYAAAIEGLLPNESELSVLQSQGRIPRDALFARDPPTAAFAGVTPATNPSEFAQVFARGFGTDNLVTNAFRLAYLEDAGANPDGGFPVLSDGLPPAAVENGLRAAFVTNDLRNWVPIAPTLLCGGNADPTVFFLNTMLMQSYWSSRSPSITPVVLDVDSTPDRSDAYASVRAGFLAAKDALRTEEVLSGASDNGDAAVLSNYHSRLVPVFCVMAAKSFFDAN